jgi:hypothetical protein
LRDDDSVPAVPKNILYIANFAADFGTGARLVMHLDVAAAAAQ